MRTTLLVLAIAAPAAAETIPMDADRWELHGEETKVIDHLGRRSLLLRDGSATLRGSDLRDGVISYDVSFTPARGFLGVAWHIQPGGNYEEFYVRPHQSGNPDANQYQPVWNGLEAWQLYSGERYGTPTKYRYDQWTHIRVVVAGASAEVYIDDMDTPALYIDELKHGAGTGSVALNASLATAIYSNFSYEPMDKPPALRGKPHPPERAPAGAIAAWRVSPAFDGKSLDGKVQLGAAEKRTSWTKLSCDPTAICNLARVQGPSPGHDTVFARVVLRADRARVAKLRFGFSDDVRLYFRERLVYGGSDVYRSRDYRFLGTIGLYDEVYLPLVAGDNEVWLAITEHFGGWGVIGAVEGEGVRVVE